MSKDETYAVSDNTDSISSSETSQADGKPACQVHESSEQAVMLAWWRCHISGDQDRHDQRIHCDDTSHDDWDQRLSSSQSPPIIPYIVLLPS